MVHSWSRDDFSANHCERVGDRRYVPIAAETRFYDGANLRDGAQRALSSLRGAGIGANAREVDGVQNRHPRRPSHHSPQRDQRRQLALRRARLANVAASNCLTLFYHSVRSMLSIDYVHLYFLYPNISEKVLTRQKNIFEFLVTWLLFDVESRSERLKTLRGMQSECRVEST